MSAINLAGKLEGISDHWSPKIITKFNGHDVMLAKAQGEFVWHSHEDTDDFFLIIKGRMTIETEEGNVELGPGDLYVVPKGMQHRPVAEEEVHFLIIEPEGTPNTGDEKTAVKKEHI
jgi:mannose-6-phosphate isomerase-like protein (cupin superfamily)